jgi:hypothetical protein
MIFVIVSANQKKQSLDNSKNSTNVHKIRLDAPSSSKLESYAADILQIETILRERSLLEGAARDFSGVQKFLEALVRQYVDDPEIGIQRYKLYELQAELYYYQGHDSEAKIFLNRAASMRGENYRKAILADEKPEITPLPMEMNTNHFEKEKSQSKKKWWLWLLFGMMLMLAITGITGFVLYQVQNKTQMPDIVGLPVDEARREIRQISDKWVIKVVTSGGVRLRDTFDINSQYKVTAVNPSIGTPLKKNDSAQEIVITATRDVPIQPLPENGETWYLGNDELKSNVMDIESDGRRGSIFIKVPDGTESYYIISKFVPDTGEQEFGIKAIFIQAGQTAELLLPADSGGSFRLYYATGESWYGQEFLFGEETQYYKTDETMGIREAGVAWEVELIRQVGGNLSTSSALPSDFE